MTWCLKWRLRLGKRLGLHFTWDSLAGVLLDDSIRNILIKILVEGKWVDKSGMFDIYPLLFEIDVLRTKMTLYIDCLNVTAVYYLLSNQYVSRYYIPFTRYYISFNRYLNPVSRYYSVLYLRKLRFREGEWSIQGPSWAWDSDLTLKPMPCFTVLCL